MVILVMTLKQRQLKFQPKTNYNLQQQDMKQYLINPFLQTNFMKNSFSYSRAVLWNSLPCDMREAKS